MDTNCLLLLPQRCLDHNAPQHHMDLAHAYKQLGKPGLAADAYLAATQLEPAHPTAHYKRGGALKQSGRLDAAAEAYRQHLALQPDHQQASSAAQAWCPGAWAWVSVSTCPAARCGEEAAAAGACMMRAVLRVQARFWLAALTGDTQLATVVPADLVADLFDQYAGEPRSPCGATATAAVVLGIHVAASGHVAPAACTTVRVGCMCLSHASPMHAHCMYSPPTHHACVQTISTSTWWASWATGRPAC